MNNCNNCHKCLIEQPSKAMPGLNATNDRMIVCPKCGNKRCPKATDHNLECTNSNVPGQRGSIYGGVDKSWFEITKELI